MAGTIVKRKIIAIILLDVLLISSFYATNQITNVHASNAEKNDTNTVNSSILSSSTYVFDDNETFEPSSVQDLELNDDAFHGTRKFLSVEWWYFDAILNDDYSLHAGFKVYSIRNIGVVYPIIEIYKERKLLYRSLQPSLLSSLSTSTSYPSVKVNGHSIIEFDRQEFNATGRWKYIVSIAINNQGVNLTFIGTTPGWKYTILEKEEWAVILPKADVYGTITIDGNTFNVTGRGYHDHNWNFTIGTKIREWGWYWGRLTGQRYTLIFAWFIKSPFKFDNLVVLNIDNHSFIEIHPRDIHLAFINSTQKFGIRIPSIIQVSVENSSVKVDVVMNTLSIHLIGPPLVYYWRFFVDVNGFISFDNDVENFVDSLQMFEVMKF